MIVVYNTLSGRKEPFEPIEKGRVKMYVCGLTVYDAPHVGHGRTFIGFDVVARWLRASGYEVTYARNITDIEDRIINRARETGSCTTIFACSASTSPMWSRAPRNTFRR